MWMEIAVISAMTTESTQSFREAMPGLFLHASNFIATQHQHAGGATRRRLVRRRAGDSPPCDEGRIAFESMQARGSLRFQQEFVSGAGGQAENIENAPGIRMKTCTHDIEFAQKNAGRTCSPPRLDADEFPLRSSRGPGRSS